MLFKSSERTENSVNRLDKMQSIPRKSVSSKDGLWENTNGKTARWLIMPEGKSINDATAELTKEGWQGVTPDTADVRGSRVYRKKKAEPIDKATLQRPDGSSTEEELPDEILGE